MVKIVFCLRRREGMSFEAFQAYWREKHAPLVASHAEALGIRRYVQAHTLPKESFAAFAAARGGPEPYDGVAELWFDSLDAVIGPADDEARRTAGRELLADEKNFIDLARSAIFVAEEHEIIPLA